MYSSLFSATIDLEIAVHIGAWAVFFSWIDLTLLSGRFDKFGEYIYMSMDVTKTLLKTIIVFTPTFIAFALAFNLLLKGNHIFHGVTTSFLKVFDMFVGELEFTNIFMYDKVKEVGGRNISVQVRKCFYWSSFKNIE